MIRTKISTNIYNDFVNSLKDEELTQYEIFKTLGGTKESLKPIFYYNHYPKDYIAKFKLIQEELTTRKKHLQAICLKHDINVFHFNKWRRYNEEID